MNNILKTTFLLSLLTILLVAMGGAVGGQGGMIVAFLMAAVMNFGSYWFSDKIVLKVYNAQEITHEVHPSFYDMIERLAGRAGLPMPKVYIIPHDSPNAFATGRNPAHAAVAAPIAAMLIQMAVSRSREYLADTSGSEICGRPLALATRTH